jgi:hypothetical protein
VSSVSLILTDSGLALSEPKAADAQGSSKVLFASSLGSCLVFVSSAVVTIALAAVGRDMRLSPLDLQWVMNAELLPLATLTLVAGALGDRFGQRRILLTGIALYGLGAAAIGFAPSFASLIVGRFLLGLGGALILPNSLSVLGQAFPADKKARAVGIWSAAAAVASGVAPAIAGAILDHGSWRTTFLMLLPVVAGALAAGAVWIPKDSQTNHARVDVGGAVLSTVGLGGLGLGLTSLTNGSGLNLLGARHFDRRTGRLIRPHRDRTAIRRQRLAAPVPLCLAVGRRREPVHRAPLRAVHCHTNLDPVRDDPGRAPADAGGGPGLHSPASADYGCLAARRHALPPVRPGACHCSAAAPWWPWDAP